MVKFNHNESLIGKAFNISTKDEMLIDELLETHRGWSCVTWIIQRVWIDERLSDNAKCLFIFNVGREYNAMQRKNCP